MIKCIEFTVPWRCFLPGDAFEFKPGLNVLVGENGAGKSTLLRELTLHLDPNTRYKKHSELDFDPATSLHAFNFEEDNPSNRRWIADPYGIKKKYGIEHAHYYAAYLSHGESISMMVQTITRLIEDATPYTVILLDEPEDGLSISTVMALIDVLKRAECQIIVCTHHPYIIEAVETVFEMDRLTWVSSGDYLVRQRRQRTLRTFQPPPLHSYGIGTNLKTFLTAPNHIQVRKLG